MKAVVLFIMASALRLKKQRVALLTSTGLGQLDYVVWEIG